MKLGICSACHGKGYEPTTLTTFRAACAYCNGSGEIWGHAPTHIPPEEYRRRVAAQSRTGWTAA